MTDTWHHGMTLRWHSNPWPALRNSGDTVDAHQNRMLRKRRDLWPGDDPRLDDAILAHDLAETFTRDWSSPMKDAIPGLQDALYAVDAVYLAHIGFTALDPDTQAKLKFLDQLDAFRWAVLHEPRCAAEFLPARRRLYEDMQALGLRGKEYAVFGG